MPGLAAAKPQIEFIYGKCNRPCISTKSALGISGQMMGGAEKASDAYMTVKSIYANTLLIKAMGSGLAQTWLCIPAGTAIRKANALCDSLLASLEIFKPVKSVQIPLSCFLKAQLPLTSQMLCSIFNTVIILSKAEFTPQTNNLK